MLNISNELKTKLIEAKSAEEVAASRIARRPWKMAAGVARTMPAIPSNAIRYTGMNDCSKAWK